MRISRRRNRTVLESEGRCSQTLLAAGSPIFCVCGLQDCGLPHWRSPVEKGLQLMLSVPLFHSEFPWQSLHVCLLVFSEASAFIALLNGRKCFEGCSSECCELQKCGECRVSLSPGRAVFILQCSCCSSASEGKLEGTKIQKGHECLWNKLECKFPMDPSCCCGG